MTVSSAPLSPISFLLRSARVWGEQIAVRQDGLTLSYAELLDRVRRTAGALRALGVEPGDRVAVLLPNVAEMLELHFAVPGIGAVIVPLNTRLGPQELDYILEHSGAGVVVAHASVRERVERAAGARAVRPEVLYVGTPDEPTLATARDAAAPADLAVPGDENALLSINYTSGTTGNPKGVMATHRGAYVHALGVVAESGLDVRSVYLWTLPMFHCNGWAYTWAVTAAGARHVCLPAVEPAKAWDLLEAEHVTHLCGAPTVLTMLAESDAARRLPGHVRTFVGGAPPAPALIDRLGRLGFDITHLYGLTETYGPIAVCARKPAWDALPDDERAALTARQGVPTIVGEPLRVVDANMDDVPADAETVGEVVMRGNNVMAGYYRDPDATETAFRGGWFHSGDLGVMHPDGYVELRDRAKDIVITGGENVATIEVEQALAAHPDVVEAAVIGVPDERWGETLRAYVVIRGDAEPSTEDLQEFVRGRLARFKVPRRVELVPGLPKTATGKIQKFVLREQALSEAG
jgi:fatty-acyl-CoA synthase